jgi:HTH-type transcriptional regulator / antitoxin HigA
MRKSGFSPDWASPPGDTIRDLLSERGISLQSLAENLGLAEPTLRELLVGNVALTLSLARGLARTLGASPEFWMCRDVLYREDLARREADEHAWLKQLPIRDMVEFGWLEASTDNQLRVCLDFFDVESVSVWRRRYSPLLRSTAFRKSRAFESSDIATAAWLRQGLREASRISCTRWNRERFATVVREIRELTRRKRPDLFLDALVAKAAECGVAVVVLPAPTGCRASGATLFTDPNRALLLLSHRYVTDDQFWFSFFHEAGHLILHDRNQCFLEDDAAGDSGAEQEANEFAAATLVPSEMRGELLALRANYLDVIRFARRAGISPGIVTGQLQHAGRLRRNQLNGVKRRYQWPVQRS